MPFGSPVLVLGGLCGHMSTCTVEAKPLGKSGDTGLSSVDSGRDTSKSEKKRSVLAWLCLWPRGCRYWTNCHVKRCIKKFGYKSTDFDGCMYGLVATKGKDAGKLINKPWRVAYLSSNVGEFLNKECDRSHEPAPCSGQNAKVTEGYTPSIARIVHSCFKYDACKTRKIISRSHR